MRSRRYLRRDRAESIDGLQIENTVSALPPGIRAYFELPVTDPGRSGFGTGLYRAACEDQHRRCDDRCIPHVRQAVYRFVRTCLAANVPFKATAGLHHPLRCFKPLTYASDSPQGTMHGFLNVFLMTVCAGRIPDHVA